MRHICVACTLNVFVISIDNIVAVFKVKTQQTHKDFMSVAKNADRILQSVWT